MSRQRPDYGIDSPAMVAGELVLSGIALAGAALLFALRVALRGPHLLGILLWLVSLLIGAYLLLMGGGMLFYSKVGKLYIRDQVLRQIPWRGDEMALDVGCGRGLLLVGAARRLTTGKAVGVDRWARGAVSGNKPEAALRNAERAGVLDRVEVKDGDARELPFPDASFDVVLSNFVLHELDSSAERERMLREIARVLKPGGRVALVDFIFTGHAVQTLRSHGVSDARRSPVGALSSLSFALVTFGLGRLCQATGSKAGSPPSVP
jgi:arsenite methyltransferase